MFNGCSKLNYLEVDFIDWWASEDSASPSWLYNVSATGTFVCPKELDESNGETRGPHAIPEGWTIIIK